MVRSSTSSKMLNNNDTSPMVDKDPVSCGSLCFAVEGFMTTLFTLPNLDFASDNSLMDSPRRSPTNNKENQRPELTPREVCRLWKTKRKLKKQELLEMRQQSTSLMVDDHELQSETKQNAQQIQRNFERRFDENDYSQRYEKYGSRAHFIRDRNL